MRTHTSVPIRLLETEPNAKGDLFTRLAEDFLLALGYESLRTNVAKAGREVDIIARHRVEQRGAVVECKATKDLVGGDALNKFWGVLDLERRRAGEDVPMEGYFVSLSGFRDTALEQELEVAAGRFALVDGTQLTTELVRGGTLVSEREAAAAASAIAGRPDDVALLDRSELVGCQLGWVWCVYFGEAGDASHVALVHASGAVLPDRLAARVIEQDRACGGRLATLQPLTAPATSTPNKEEALQAYNAYLRQEFGSITLEGLPADQELGSRRIDLSDLFVPLALLAHVAEPDEEDPEQSEPDDEFEDEAAARTSVDAVLAAHRQVSILAVPGGGKSTLLKHLATGYCDQLDRAIRGEADHRGMPFPVMIRCRQLTEVNGSLVQTLKEIPERGEFPHLAEAFGRLLETALLDGRLTVLIDGLDEIADDRGRVAFASQLRTFASVYPDVQLVVTSRPGGYRVVSGVLAPVCATFRIAEFDDEDIAALTERWHRVVVGPSRQVQEEAAVLAARIVATDRVRRLATNPLLLTTLLLVKRWVGDLPRKRSVLYARAIEVLLMTWNVEGHDPIDQEEALPQLAWVAYEMTAGGEQTVTEPRLTQLLRDARAAMPDVLGYTKTGVAEFVRRIEDRSSVLSLSGHTEEAGRVVAQYEFKHLTFQEYLTARAVTDSFCAPRVAGATLLETLEDRLGRPDWNEVVPLAAVLAGREAGPLIRRFITRCEAHEAAEAASTRRPAWAAELLARCLADEVQITPDLAVEACRAVGKKIAWGDTALHINSLLDSRFGPTLRTISSDAVQAGGEALADLATVTARISCRDLGVPIMLRFGRRPTAGTAGWPQRVEAALDSPDWIEQTRGCLAVMHVAWMTEHSGIKMRDPDQTPQPWLQDRAECIARLLCSERESVSFSAAWALAWLGSRDLIPVPLRMEVLVEAFALWREEKRPAGHRRMAAWAFSCVPLVDRDAPIFGQATERLEAFLVEERASYRDPRWGPRRNAALFAAYYLRAPWPDHELIERCLEDPDAQSILRRIVETLET